MKKINCQSRYKYAFGITNKTDDILDVCPFDLSFDSEYISGYLFLTSTKIGVAKSRHEQMTVRYFRGTKTADMQYAEDEKEYMLEWFDFGGYFAYESGKAARRQI